MTSTSRWESSAIRMRKNPAKSCARFRRPSPDERRLRLTFRAEIWPVRVRSASKSEAARLSIPPRQPILLRLIPSGPGIRECRKSPRGLAREALRILASHHRLPRRNLRVQRSPRRNLIHQLLSRRPRDRRIEGRPTGHRAIDQIGLIGRIRPIGHHAIDPIGLMGHAIGPIGPIDPIDLIGPIRPIALIDLTGLADPTRDQAGLDPIHATASLPINGPNRNRAGEACATRRSLSSSD
jgi:hypothetical protein